MQNYLDNFWPDLKAARELCESILQSRRERENESQESHGKEYPEHVPLEVLEAGIKSGRYVQVRVAVEDRRRTNQCVSCSSLSSSCPRPLISKAVSEMASVSQSRQCSRRCGSPLCRHRPWVWSYSLVLLIRLHTKHRTGSL